MTEAEWLTTTNLPKAMLRQVARSASPRKLRLIAGLGCDLVRECFEPSFSDYVTAVVLHADGIIDEVRYLELREPVLRFANSGDSIVTHVDARSSASKAAESLLYNDVGEGTQRAVDWLVEAAVHAAPHGDRGTARTAIRRQICDLIREVLGNPFRPFQPVASWLGGGFVQPDGRQVQLTEPVRGLAAGIHADQAFERLPLLADALEDAGASDPDLLAHCRTGAGHVRGCWALDVALGKT